MRRVIIVGGGPAGMMAAIAAANAAQSREAGGIEVILLEKNEKLGKKLHLTGKGRCNVTNAVGVAGLMAHVIRNPRFLHSAFHGMDSAALMSFVEGLGVPLKVERGGRVFPVGDKADDISKALSARLRQSGVRVKLRAAVEGVEAIYGEGSEAASFIVKTGGLKSGGSAPEVGLRAHALVLATGGLSYPSTGATGEGLTFARALGHTVAPTFPSLVPLLAQEPWIPALAGLSLRNVRLTARLNGKTVYGEIGEMLFTPEGVTGPLVLKASAYLADRFGDKPTLSLDLKPGLGHEQLDARIQRDFSQRRNMHFGNALNALLPQRMVAAVVGLSGVAPDTQVSNVTRAQRKKLVDTLKDIPIVPVGTAGYAAAVITRGGVDTREVNPSTLMSKKIPGLFFAGECLDVDALTGGYNLQIAFSTGYLAGMSAAGYLLDRV
jgi:hypothetical protein